MNSIQIIYILGQRFSIIILYKKTNDALRLGSFFMTLVLKMEYCIMGKDKIYLGGEI